MNRPNIWSEGREIIFEDNHLLVINKPAGLLVQGDATGDEPLSAKAAEYLRFTPEGIRKARRAGRLSGVRLNEKEWGFRLSELDRYVKRYHRQLPPPTTMPLGRPLMVQAA